ncbi:hypothetical protein RUM43_002388 [Polyplax serrata]|uniref:Serine hydrolase domain-containing protein n=1 Tax=Polyplax serrata TaxID=468196 RepID=A0AAN8PCM4_POLSC
MSEVKLKILCLHGYRQNATKFRSQTGALRKNLKNVADFHFLSAPHVVPYTEHYEGDENEERAWWFTTPTSFSSRDETSMDKGLTESLNAIKKYFLENGPFDGILGFSQGACLTGLICALKERKEIDLDFSFAIIVAGFQSRCTLHRKFYDQKININSLHVIGETDQIISNSMSYALVDTFVNASVIKHPGGHFVPGKSVLKDQYITFLQAQQKM